MRNSCLFLLAYTFAPLMVLAADQDIRLEAPYRITEDDVVLQGTHALIQTDPAAPVLVIEGAKRVRIEGLTITRAEGVQEATAPGILIIDCEEIVLDSVRVRNCKARDPAIEIRSSRNCTVRDSVVQNYKRIAVDDRTDSELYGYAFRAIDGTGILVNNSVGTVIEGNRIVEDALLPTRDMKDEHQLGSLTDGAHPTVPGELGKSAVKSGYVNNWHQGSAIVVTGPTVSRDTLIRGNHIVNAAQGIDLHSDFAIVSDNIIDHAMIGLKGTHGCRGHVWSNNIIRNVDLWGILLNPGSGSYLEKEGAPEPNVDGGIVITGNIIADYGYGHEFWNWGGSHAIALFDGQLAENPPLRDVVISNNVVYDPGRDTGEEPHYRYAVYIGGWDQGETPDPNWPQDIQFMNNRFHPGRDGVSNGAL